MEPKKAPALRFKGFSGDWQSQKLACFVADLKSGLSRMLSSTDIGLPVVRANNIDNNTLNLLTDIKYWYRDDPQGADTQNYYIHKDDILINFINSPSKMGTAAMVEQEPSRDTIYTTNILRLRLNDKCDEKFFLYQTYTKNYTRYIKDISKIAVNQASFTTVEFKNLDMTVPQLAEQQKIGEMLRQVDRLIAAERERGEQLRRLRRALLDRLFPAPGTVYPALRLKNFTAPWQRRKLGDMVDRVVRKNTNNESTLPLTISAQYGLVDQITYFNNRVASRDVSNYYLVLNGEFAYNKSSSDGYPFGTVKRLDLYEKGVLSTLYIVFAIKENQPINSDFLAVFFETDRWYRDVAERAAEGARNHGLLNISADDFLDIDICLPDDIEEQNQIAALLTSFDRRIALAEQRLEHLSHLKSACLQRLFI